MARKNRSPEENARRNIIRELLQAANVESVEDIQSLFREAIGEFVESGLESELDEELGYAPYDQATREQRTAATDTAKRHCVQAPGMSRYRFPGTEKASSIRC